MKSLRLFGIFWLLFLSVLGRSQTDPVVLYGYMEEFRWSDREDALAVLFTDPNNNQFIYLLEAGKEGVARKLFIPPPYRVKSMDWLSDDSGFLLAASEEDDFADRFYRLDRASGEVRPWKDSVEILYYGIGMIDIDGATGRWAVLYHGEGHPDIAVYDAHDQLILSSDVYPGGIGIRGWKDGTLFVASDMPLEWGLDREAREKYMKKHRLTYENTELPFEEYRDYRLDLVTRKAKPVPFQPDGRSPSGKYSLKFERQEDIGDYPWFSVKLEEK